MLMIEKEKFKKEEKEIIKYKLPKNNILISKIIKINN